MREIKLLFAGSGTLGVGVLERLAKNPRYKVAAVVLLEEKPAGRGLLVLPSPLEKAARENKLIVQKIRRESEMREMVRTHAPDIVLVASFGMIIKKESLDLTRWINIHPSLLPRYRGATPVPEALRNGDTKTGITWMRMAEKMDAGGVIAQVELPIYEEDDFFSLWERITKEASARTPNILKLYMENPREIEQDHAKATYCTKIRKENGHMDFLKETAEDIVNKVRAYSAWPTSFFFWDKKRIKVLKARRIEQKLYPGEISAEKRRLIIGAATGAVEIFSLQPESKKPMSAEDFLRGVRKIPKTIF